MNRNEVLTSRRFHRTLLQASRNIEGLSPKFITTIRLTYLDPNDSIDRTCWRAGGGAETESSSFDVAPIAPSSPNVLDTRAALINNEGGRETCIRKKGSECVDVMDLVVIRVSLGNRVGRGGLESVVIGDVCGKTTDTVRFDGGIKIGK